jgi:hypothetical protein
LKLPPELPSTADPYGGFLLWGSFWRPNPEADNPEMPGLKQQTIIYIPVDPGEDCLCGSGKSYRRCCQPKRNWQLICHDLGAQSYSFVVPQEASFSQVDGKKLKRQLVNDYRLNCVENTENKGFWNLWGEEIIETEFGIICFGDIELKGYDGLLVTAMSDSRLRYLLDLLKEIASDCIGEPKITKDSPKYLPKPIRPG